jgi:hypothetical protein
VQAISEYDAVTHATLPYVLSGPRFKESHPTTWSPELSKAFEKCKASLLRATRLARPDPSAPLEFVTDASTPAMYAVLEQIIENAWQPLFFFPKSRTLSNRITAPTVASCCPSTRLRSPYNATLLIEDLDRAFKVLYGSKCSSPSKVCAPGHQSNGEAGRAAFCVARRAERFSHLSTSFAIPSSAPKSPAIL